MFEWLVSSSVLIVMIIALRFVVKGKISLRLQYGLWALVLVRLLIPVSFGGSPISVENVTQEAVALEPVQFVSTALQTESPNLDTSTSDYQLMNRESSVGEVTKIVWLCGIAVIGICFVFSNLRLYVQLKRTRILLSTNHALPVYFSDVADTPCLFGLLRPAVYLSKQAFENEEAERHAIAHELTHYRHKDHIWAILRCVCVTIHWFNPLVWYAAVLSRSDAELACDEATILHLGEKERASYGRTLIRLTCEKTPQMLNTATTMTASGRNIKERIAFIAKKPKTTVYTLALVVAVSVFAMGCTFTGVDKQPASEESHDIVSAYLTLENGKAYLDEVEIITEEDEDRIEDLGLNIEFDLISGYYIHNEREETMVYELMDETVYRFLDIGQLYTSEEGLKYETTSLEEFLAGSSYVSNSASENSGLPTGRIPYFVEIEGGNVISITEVFSYTI